MPDAPGLHHIIMSRSSTAKETTTLDAVKVEEMEPSEATELFQRYAKITEEGSDVTREVDGIVKELGYLALAITLSIMSNSIVHRLELIVSAVILSTCGYSWPRGRLHSHWKRDRSDLVSAGVRTNPIRQHLGGNGPVGTELGFRG